MLQMFSHIRNKRPLIHCITNYVTVNDCANILLAAGAAPVMADDIDEVEEMTALADALVINIGTLNTRTIDAMCLAGKKANALGHPVVLDPVGAGATTLRTKTVERLLGDIRFTAIRGNASELRALSGTASSTQGVDAAACDAVQADRMDSALAFASAVAKQTGSIIAMTGAVDIIADSDGTRAATIRNGHPMMASVTGTGCQLSALLGASLAVHSDDPFPGAVHAVLAMGVAGELAQRRLSPADGNATYRNAIIDTICHMTDSDVKEAAQYECRTL